MVEIRRRGGFLFKYVQKKFNIHSRAATAIAKKIGGRRDRGYEA